MDTPARLSVPAHALEVKNDAWFIAENPGIVAWLDNCHITWPNVEFGAILHPRAKSPGNDMAKMGTLVAFSYLRRIAYARTIASQVPRLPSPKTYRQI